MKYDLVEVGNRIRNARNTLGMSQEAFAEALGIGRVHLATQYLKKLKCPTEQKVQLLGAVIDSAAKNEKQAS